MTERKDQDSFPGYVAETVHCLYCGASLRPLAHQLMPFVSQRRQLDEHRTLDCRRPEAAE